MKKQYHFSSVCLFIKIIGHKISQQITEEKSAKTYTDPVGDRRQDKKQADYLSFDSCNMLYR